jgi:isopropylmalate/homocitrate/citramalate synthase
MTYPSTVKIVEVGPRDGLQNEVWTVPLKAKIELIESLVDAGIRAIECGSFVSPKRVPQMADSQQIAATIGRRSGVVYSFLVPNIKGLEAALEAGVRDVAVFASASEGFSRANINCSIDESLVRLGSVIQEALRSGVSVRGYVSCVLGSPYESEVPISQVLRVATELYEAGCYEISLGDTIGVGTPLRVQHLLQQVTANIPIANIAVHFHDTWGQALANILMALESGVSVIDSSVAGLGGCPFAPGATGNVATEDVLYMMDGMGIETGIDLDKVARAGRAITTILGRKPMSKVAIALESSRRSEG